MSKPEALEWIDARRVRRLPTDSAFAVKAVVANTVAPKNMADAIGSTCGSLSIVEEAMVHGALVASWNQPRGACHGDEKVVRFQFQISMVVTPKVTTTYRYLSTTQRSIDFDAKSRSITNHNIKLPTMRSLGY
jgi:hypothetical protein